jgi:hypothetical protein
VEVSTIQETEKPAKPSPVNPLKVYLPGAAAIVVIAGLIAWGTQFLNKPVESHGFIVP